MNSRRNSLLNNILYELVILQIKTILHTKMTLTKHWPIF